MEEKNQLGIYVDVKNLWHYAKDKLKAKISYSNLVKLLKDDSEITVLNAYTVFLENVDVSKFEKGLLDLKFSLKKKPLNKSTNNPYVWDTGITIDVLSDLEKWDTAMLVCPSDNQLDLLRHLRRNSIEVEVAGFEKCYSKTFLKEVDNFIDLSTKPELIYRDIEFRKHKTEQLASPIKPTMKEVYNIDYAGLPKDEE